MTRVGIIVGSTRPRRVGLQVADWVIDRAIVLPGFDSDLIDLAVSPLPFLDEPNDASTGIYTKQHTRDWSHRISALDAFILVTPEYNNSFSAPLKNALDFLSAEWQGKPVAVVAYGNTSSGTRAAQALLPVISALGMFSIGAVFLPLRDRFLNGQIVTTAHEDENATALFASLIDLSSRLGTGADRDVRQLKSSLERIAQ